MSDLPKMPSRRRFLKGGSALTALTVLPAGVGALAQAPPLSPEPPADAAELEGVQYANVDFVLNGEPVSARVDTRRTLLDLLRHERDLHGTRKGCNHGACGACTVHIDGRNTNACLQLAALLGGREVTTIEGLAATAGDSQVDGLHPLQAAFVQHDGFQCGYCTSGQIMTAATVVEDGHASSRAEIRELMSGNLCRCGAYNGIVDAVEDVIQQNA